MLSEKHLYQEQPHSVQNDAGTAPVNVGTYFLGGDSLRSLAPLQSGEGIRSKVAKHVHLHPLPFHLNRCWCRPEWHRGILRGKNKSERNEKQEQQFFFSCQRIHVA